MKEYMIGQAYYGFTLRKVEEMKDIHSKAYLFFHEQSGARLLYLRNEDNNKVFNVAFKTPPSDDCGTPHILEHAVLCGSRKYEAKDPFNELAKGSLNTFLNAMTYADKTMYPIASCNEKDFHNLMDVYLDAVFYPKIYEKKEIFLQEGWRYLLKDEDAPLEITGVVYNEMQGALSDPESLLSGVIARSVFGKTTYGFESGGDPAAIPDLTYEDFLAFHKKYYHPSNAYFYLYGDMDVMACLKQIHEGYLSDFTVSDQLPVIEISVCAEKGRIVYETYPVAEDGEKENAYLAYTIKVGMCTDAERIMALQILSYVLLETNSSPLKRALLDAGICQETEGSFDSSTYEMVFSIIAKNADVSKVDAFIHIVEQQWKRLVAEGLPKDLLQSALRKFDFLLREEDYGSTPKGLVYCSRLMKRWLHGEDPLDSLRSLELIEKLKKEYTEGYFENLIATVFLHNDEKTYVVFTPEKGKAQKDAEKLKEKLKQKKSQMTEADLQQIKEDSETLDFFQKTVETPEILAQIPVLEISEIDEAPHFVVSRIDRLEKGNPLLYVPIESNGILYLKLHFDLSKLPLELVPYSGLLADLLGKLDTEKHSFQELPTVLNRTFGGFSTHHNTYHKNAKEYRTFLTVKAKLLREDIKKAFAMIEEILFSTKFSEIENMKKIIKSVKIKGENSLLNQSHYFAIFYSASHLFPGMYLDDATTGIRYYRFLCKIEEDLERAPDSVIHKLKEAAEVLFRQTSLEAAFGSEEVDFEAVKEQFNQFVGKIPESKKEMSRQEISILPQKTAFTNTGGVLYNATSFEFLQKGIPYHGKLQVLQTIINLEYLWNKVRVQGGAYGCGCNFQKNGLSYFYSYRDPNLKETYDIYQRLQKDISAFTASEREMTKYIIGTINRLDQPQTNLDRLNTAISQYYKEISDEILLRERLEILQTTDADIRECQKLLTLLDCQNICSIGNEQKIKAESDFFTTIEPLI